MFFNALALGKKETCFESTKKLTKFVYRIKAIQNLVHFTAKSRCKLLLCLTTTVNKKNFTKPNNKTNMKRKIAITCIFSIVLNMLTVAQNNDVTTILIVGTMHKLPGLFTGNYKYIKKRILQFKPEIFCSEYIIPTDSISFEKFYGMDYIKQYDSILRAEHVVLENVQGKIDSLNLLLNGKDSVMLRYLLSRQYSYLKDFGNMALQNYIVYNTMKKSNLSKIERQKVLKRYNPIKNNEYDLIAFPYCYQNNINYIFPIDDHSFETEYNEYTNNWKQEFEGKLNKQQHAYYSKYKRKLIWLFFIGKGGKMVNSFEGQKFSYKLEANLFDSTVSENYNKASEFWKKRNENMAKNIISVANKNRNKRIVVMVGASHIPFIKEYLEKLSSFKILTLPEIE